MKVNLAFHLEIKVPESGGRVERNKLLEVQFEVSTVSDVWDAMSSAGVGPLCFLKSTVNVVLPETFRALRASFCWQAFMEFWFNFPAGLGTCPHSQRYQKLVQWPWCYCAWLASKQVWPEPHRESRAIVKRKMRDTRPNNAEELKAAIKATCASLHLTVLQADVSCHAALMQ